MKRKQATRKTARAQDTECLAEASRNVRENPEWAAIRKELSVPEIVEAVKANATKRSKGRPARPDKFEILDAAAQIRAADGYYMTVARRFQIKEKQLTDLVQKNRSYFDRKVQEFQLRKNT